MAGGPLGDHIGDEHPVVFRGEDVGGAGGAGDVGAVHPRIAGEDDVDQVAGRPRLVVAAYLLQLGHDAAADETWRAAPPAGGLRGAGGETAGDLFWRHVLPFVDLQAGQGIDEHPAAAAGQPGLPVVLPDRGRHLHHAQRVRRHRAHVPARAVGRSRPVAGAQRPQQVREALVLGSRRAASRPHAAGPGRAAGWVR
jgi:hypothetical protein